MLVWCFDVSGVTAQESSRSFIGAVVGISTLSADARSVTTADTVAISLYKPENGPALNVFFGVVVEDYVTIQANYIWNRNDLTLLSTRATRIEQSFYEQRRNSSQHAMVGDVLVYFRERRSRIRPYLSGGVGVLRFESQAGSEVDVRGAALAPSRSFAATAAVLRVAVGMDLAVGGRWRFRYSFSEAISRNPISAELSPSGQRNLANFQNLFGLIRVL